MYEPGLVQGGKGTEKPMNCFLKKGWNLLFQTRDFWEEGEVGQRASGHMQKKKCSVWRGRRRKKVYDPPILKSS